MSNSGLTESKQRVNVMAKVKDFPVTWLKFKPAINTSAKQNNLIQKKVDLLYVCERRYRLPFLLSYPGWVTYSFRFKVATFHSNAFYVSR